MAQTGDDFLALSTADSWELSPLQGSFWVLCLHLHRVYKNMNF